MWTLVTICSVGLFKKGPTSRPSFPDTSESPARGQTREKELRGGSGDANSHDRNSIQIPAAGPSPPWLAASTSSTSASSIPAAPRSPPICPPALPLLPQVFLPGTLQAPMPTHLSSITGFGDHVSPLRLLSRNGLQGVSGCFGGSQKLPSPQAVFVQQSEAKLSIFRVI